MSCLRVLRVTVDDGERRGVVVVGRGRRLLCVVLGIGLTGSVLVGCSSSSGGGASGASGASGGGAPSGSAPVVTGTSPIGSTPTGSDPTGTAPADPPPSGPTGSPSPSSTDAPRTTPGPGTPSSPAPASADGLLRLGASGPRVLDAQQRLAALGYWIGTPDGKYGDLTQQAVTALQKVAGLSRDGVLGPKTAAALEKGRRPSAHSSSGHVVEIDLKHQVLMIVDDGKVGRILNASTGSGAWYTAPDGHRAHATTSIGKFAVEWAVDRWDTSPLGHLYRPRYFHPRGIAVHGFPSVPPFAASHGCVRVSVPAMDMIWSLSLMPLKGAVWVY